MGARTKNPPMKSTITLYSAEHAMSSSRKRRITNGSAWASRIPEAYSLVGVEFHPDETSPKRWIVENGSGHPIYVQHPSFADPVIKVHEGCSMALVDGSRITAPPCKRWLNVTIRLRKPCWQKSVRGQ